MIRVKNVDSNKSTIIVSDVLKQANAIKYGQTRAFYETDELVLSLNKGALKSYVDRGLVKIIDASEKYNIDKIIDWIISNDVKFGFSAGSYSGSAGGTVEVEIRVTDGDGTIDTFNNIVQVTVAVDGNATIQESMPIRFTNGIAKITIQDDTAETVNLSLVDSESTGLDVSDTATVVFS